MKITFLGTGTSTGTPLIGCDCEVCLSNDKKDQRLRSSVFIEVNNLNILIDIGPDFRQQMLRAKIRRIDAVLLTHEHNDHIIGLDEIRAFNFLQQQSIPIYGSERVINAVRERFPYLFQEILYPGAPRVEVFIVDKNQSFLIRNTSIVPIEYFHGRMPILGYKIENFTYLTDFKTINQVEFQKIKKSKLLVLSALQIKQHHSHLNLEEALDWAKKMDAEQTYFIHMGHRIGKHELVDKQLPKNIHLSYDGLIIEI